MYLDVLGFRAVKHHDIQRFFDVLYHDPVPPRSGSHPSVQPTQRLSPGHKKKQDASDGPFMIYTYHYHMCNILIPYNYYDLYYVIFKLNYDIIIIIIYVNIKHGKIIGVQPTLMIIIGALKMGISPARY